MKRDRVLVLAVLLLLGSLCLFLAAVFRADTAARSGPVQLLPSQISSHGAGLTSIPAPAPTPAKPALEVAAQKASPRRASLAAKGKPQMRPWDRSFLSSLADASEGDALSFELLRGESASGNIGHLDRSNGQVIYVSGALTSPEPGRFFFQKQTRPGVAGEFVGVVEFPGTGRAYRIEPAGLAGAPELVERAMSDVLCYRLPFPPAAPGSSATNTPQIPPLNPGNFPDLPIPGYQNGICVLESLHGSAAVIYLDFQGGYTATWGGITYARPAVTNDQIREVWRRVAEDLMPFNINVTTDLGVFQNAPEGSRQRIIITPTQTAAPDAGGVAYVGSFDYTGDMPCWVFFTSGKDCAEACSHEAGHALGLARHEGQDHNGVHVEYYTGQGVGDTGWAPIMGVGYYGNVSQWSRGDYLYADNTDDELALIISSNNGVSNRVDDTGDTLATSRYLELYPDYSAGAEGVIERTDDTDAFQFTTGGGTVSLRADPVSVGPNLALAVSLYDGNDALVLSNCPQDTLWADLNTNLPAGTYTFRVTGTGRGDPLVSGFSTYASLGYYSITGSVANARLPDRFSVLEHATNGTLVGIISPRNGSGDPLACTMSSGNYSNAFALDNSGVLTVSNNEALDYTTVASQTQLAVQFELFVTLTDLSNPALSEINRRVVIALVPVLGPPVITLQPHDTKVAATYDTNLLVSATADQAFFDPLNYQWFFNGTPIAGATTTQLTISSAQDSNGGDYSVVVTNFEGAVTSAVAILTVTPAPPEFTIQPVSQSVPINSTASFSSAVNGSQPISFQWQFDGTDLPGQTNSYLSLANVNLSNEGAYQVIASNLAGSIESSPVLLSVFDLIAWGWDDYGQTNVPLGLTNVVQISAGAEHNLVLFDNGTVGSWGSGPQTNVPAGLTNVVAIAAGGSHSLALTSDGSVAVWGDNSLGQTNLPQNLTNVVAIAAGGGHSLVLKSDGTVTAWGNNNYGQCKVPAGFTNIIAIAAGSNHCLAIKGDGTVAAWGDNRFGQTAVPTNLTDVVAISAGTGHSLALDAYGRLFAWGDNSYGQLQVPGGTNQLAAIAAGAFHNLMLRTDGSLYAWGAGLIAPTIFPNFRQSILPLDAVGIAGVAAGTAHSLVLIGNGSPFITKPPLGRIAYRNSPLALRVEATGLLPLSFQWLLDGNILPGATNQQLRIDDATSEGQYQVIVSNSFGIATSPAASIVLVDHAPLVLVQPLSQKVFLGSQLLLNVIAEGTKPLSYQWRFNAQDIPGATNSTLFLDHLLGSQSGLYSVVLSNALGVVSSEKADVEVQQVAAWGDDSYGQTDVPPGLLNVVQVAGGDYHTLALRSDGTVVAWGTGSVTLGFERNYGQTTVSPEAINVIAVAAGGFHSLALRSDGTVVAWGAGLTNAGFYPHYGQSIVPNGLSNVVAIAAGTYHSVALKSDGRVVVWGGQPPGNIAAVPQAATNVVAITSMGYFVTALKSDGTLLNWGSGGGGIPFSPGLVAIGPSIGLRNNGIVFAIGTPQPPGLTNVVQIAGGGYSQFLARKSDGTMATWGTTFFGLNNLPPGLTNVIAVACGRGQSIAAIGDGSVQITAQPCDRQVVVGERTLLSVTAGGSPPLQFQWRFNGLDLPGATNFWLWLSPLQFTNAGGYSVTVGNASQTLTSRVANVSVYVPPVSLPVGIALGAPGFNWESQGNAPWFGETNVTHNGIAAAQSGPILDSQQSTLEFSAFGPATVSFWWKVSSEQYFDLLTFSINNQVQQTISGDSGWLYETFSIPPALSGQANVLSWTYSKDPTLSAGSDAGWLSEVVISNEAPAILQQPVSQIVPAGTNVLLSVNASGAPPLAYQWSRNGTNLAGATGAQVFITSTTRHLSGLYSVAVSNPAGTTLSSNALVLVRVPQQLASPAWPTQGVFRLISQDADSAPLFARDLAGFEAQFSTNLLEWITLSNPLTLSNGVLLLTDPHAATNSHRFYRIVEH